MGGTEVLNKVPIGALGVLNTSTSPGSDGAGPTEVAQFVNSIVIYTTRYPRRAGPPKFVNLLLLGAGKASKMGHSPTFSRLRHS